MKIFVSHAMVQPALPQAVPGGGVFRKAAVKPTLILLAIAWTIPFVLHMVPWGGATPLGAFLLPMYWAAFVAVYLYGLGIGLVVGLFSPALNLAMTGLPVQTRQAAMIFELFVFVMLAWSVLRTRQGRKFWLLAPLAYIAAEACVMFVRMTGAEIFGAGAPPATRFAGAVTTGMPGLLMLAFINFALVRGWLGNRGGEDENGGHGPEQAA